MEDGDANTWFNLSNLCKHHIQNFLRAHIFKEMTGIKIPRQNRAFNFNVYSSNFNSKSAPRLNEMKVSQSQYDNEAMEMSPQFVGLILLKGTTSYETNNWLWPIDLFIYHIRLNSKPAAQQEMDPTYT